MINLSALPLPLLGAVLAASLLLMQEIGYRCGRRMGASDETMGAGHLLSAALALLGLLIAFTFSMASDRYEARRALVLEEANALSTTYLRVQALDEPFRGRLSQGVVAYGQARQDFFAAGEDRQKLAAAEAETDALQARLWADLMPAVRAADHARSPSVDTSPSNGLISGGDPYVKRWGVTSTKRHASAGSRGDIHYYNYQADCEDPSTYPLARFVSEHGFQAFPSMDVYEGVTSPGDWSRDAPFGAFRMRHPDGNAQALAMMARHFRVPPADCGPPPCHGCSPPCDQTAQRALFASYLYLTQLQQARCYETAFTHWR